MIKKLNEDQLPALNRIKYLGFNKEKILIEISRWRKFNHEVKKLKWNYSYRIISVNQYLRFRDYLRVITNKENESCMNQ